MFLPALIILGQIAREPVAIWPGAVESAHVVYLTTRDGGVQAVDLASGKKLWTSAAAQWPLEVVNGALVAAGHNSADKPNDLSIVCLRISDGSVAARSTVSLPLPPDTSVLLNYDEPNPFSMQSTVDSQGKVVIHWHAVKPNQIGIQPNPAFLRKGPIDAKGVICVDPTTAQVIEQSPSEEIVVAFPKYSGRDPLENTRSILWPATQIDGIRIYPTEIGSPKDLSGVNREMFAIAVDVSNGRLLWQIPIAVRQVQGLRM